MAQSTYSLDFASTGAVNMSSVGALYPAISVSCWIKTTANNQIFFESSLAGTTIFQLYITTGNVVRWLVDAATPLAGATSVTDGAWHHVLGTVDGSGNQKLYIDGILDASASGVTPLNTSGDVFTIGGRSSFQYTGKFDDAAVWATDQSSNAAGIASGATNVGTLSPLDLWRLEEGTGTTAADTGSGGHNGTLSGGVVWSSDVPAALAGGGGGVVTAAQYYHLLV